MTRTGQYQWNITTSTNTEKTTTVTIKGHAVTRVAIRFPPGPEGLLWVQVYYGIKQLWPHNSGEWFRGDDELIDWEEYWELPESPCNLQIKTMNMDDTYSHEVLIRITTMTRAQMLADRIAQAIKSAIAGLLSWW